MGKPIFFHGGHRSNDPMIQYPWVSRVTGTFFRDFRETGLYWKLGNLLRNAKWQSKNSQWITKILMWSILIDGNIRWGI